MRAEVPGWIVERDSDDPVVTIEYEWNDTTHRAVVSLDRKCWVPREPRSWRSVGT